MTKSQIKHLAILECKMAHILIELRSLTMGSTMHELLKLEFEIIKHELINANYKPVSFLK